MRPLIFALLFAATTASAQSVVNVDAVLGPEDYVRYLIPLVQRDVRGANGSVWTSDLQFRNRWDRDMPILGPLCSPIADPCVPPINIPPGTTVSLALQPRGDGTDGAFLYVPIGLFGPRPAITLHVRDTSKGTGGFGTQVVTPRIDEYQPQVDLIAIPTDPRYRGTLRIYGSGAQPQVVRVRTYSETGNNLLNSQLVTLYGIVNIAFDPFPSYPAYAQLDAVPDSARAADADRVRIVVDTPDTDANPVIWAFVTITDNVTQLTSTIVPNR
jgi:hypothetical protein